MSVAEPHKVTDDAAPQPAVARDGVASYLGLWARGFAMGSADVVPGVSGGTMALIMGIYEELIDSIRALTQPPFLRAVTSGRIAEAWRAGNLSFLVVLAVGILSAVLTFARVLEFALETYPVYLWSFFFGLIVASVWVVGRRLAAWTPLLILTTIIGALIAFWIVGLVPAQTPETWWFLILSGAIAICAMILPGISGAFILLILGKYEFVVSAVKDFDIGVIALVGVGAFIGLVSFARVLSWLLHRYHDLTLTVLIGLMIGSLRKIWPWKEEVDLANEIYRNVMPAVDETLLLALLLMVIGFVAVILLERLAPEALDPDHPMPGHST